MGLDSKACLPDCAVQIELKLTLHPTNMKAFTAAFILKVESNIFEPVQKKLKLGLVPTGW